MLIDFVSEGVGWDVDSASLAFCEDEHDSSGPFGTDVKGIPSGEVGDVPGL